MIRRLTFLFAVVTLVSPLATGWLYASETHSTTITFIAPVHFLMLDGNDVQVPAGTYRIEQAGETQLYLTAESKPSIELQATRVTHEETINVPMVMIVMEDGQEDEIHLILVLSGGEALDATGSLSGARSRAVSASALRPIQIQSAVNQGQSHACAGACSALASANGPCSGDRPCAADSCRQRGRSH